MSTPAPASAGATGLAPGLQANGGGNALAQSKARLAGGGGTDDAGDALKGATKGHTSVAVPFQKEKEGMFGHDFSDVRAYVGTRLTDLGAHAAQAGDQVVFVMSNTAVGAVTASGDNYTAMSEKEFFANCYATFFADPAGFVDHTKWGGTLSADVQSFMRTHVLERQPYTPPVGGGAGANPPAGAGTNPALQGGDPGTP